jgi:tetratricopeptide (TPR) repeat protein
MGFTAQQAQDALRKFDNNLERATNYLLDNPQQSQQMESETIQYDAQAQEQPQEDESLDPEYYKQKAQEYQKLALAAKKQGDKRKAVELLRESKAYKQKYDDVAVLAQSELNNDKQEEQPLPVQRDQTPPLEEETVYIQQQQQQRTPTPPPMTSPQVSIPAAKLEKAQETLQQVIKLQKEYKEAALHYKNLGNLSVARQMVKTSKELLHTGIQLKNGEIFDANLPSRPDMSLGDGKMHQVVEQPYTNISSTSQIENQLAYQLNVSHNLAIQNSTNKKNKMTMSNRDHFAALEHALQADVLSLKGNSSDEIPPLHFEQVNYTYQNVIDTIPSTMMEFKIIKATSLPTLDISTHLEPFVTWDFNGWPPENAAQAAMNKGETPIAQGIEPGK